MKKGSQLSTRCLHQGAAGLNDKVPIKNQDGDRRLQQSTVRAELAQVDPLPPRNYRQAEPKTSRDAPQEVAPSDRQR